jgi:hypothetical protein
VTGPNAPKTPVDDEAPAETTVAAFFDAIPWEGPVDPVSDIDPDAGSAGDFFQRIW